MIVIAVLLLAAVAAATAGVIAGAQEDAVFDIFDETITISGPEVFALGLACGLAAAAALWMVQVGARRTAVRRRELRNIRAERRQLEAERERLRAGESAVGTGPTGEPEPDTAHRPRFAWGNIGRRRRAETDEERDVRDERVVTERPPTPYGDAGRHVRATCTASRGRAAAGALRARSPRMGIFL